MTKKPKAPARMREMGKWKLGQRVAIVVKGIVPVAKGNMRALMPKGGKWPVVTDAGGSALKTWERTIRDAMRQTLDALGIPCAVEQPFEALLVLYMPRPNGDFSKSKPNELLPSARTSPWVAPDLDKLERAVHDACSKVAFDDDSRIVRVVKEKRYADADHDVGLWLELRVRPATLREEREFDASEKQLTM